VNAEQRDAEFLAELLEALPSLVAFVDRDERTRYVNRAVRVWIGREPEDCVGMTLREFLGDDAYALVRDHVAAASAGRRQSFRRATVLPGGEVVHALTEYVPRWREGRPDGFTVLVTDVTGQERAELALAEDQLLVRELRSRSRTAATLTDDVLQELFAISLHLERLRRFPEEAWTVADKAIGSLSGTIETLRSTVKHLVADVERRPPEPGGGRDG